jgi:hypothetical protein
VAVLHQSSTACPRHNPALVPVAAVQNIGNEQVVFIATTDQTSFTLRPVRLGPENNGYYPALEGLNAGDRIVTSGSFTEMDSQSLVRITHLLAILIVVMEVFLKLNCPLTTWENQARASAQQQVDGSAFMDRLLSFILIGSAPRWVINGAYCVFAIAILATFFLAPPRWKSTGKKLVVGERG